MTATTPRFDTSGTVLRRALVGGVVLSVAIGVVAGLVGLLLAGPGGLASGLIGALFAFLFLGLTIGGLMVSARLVSDVNPVPAIVVVLVGFLAKVVLFVVAMVALGHQPWVQPMVLFVALVAAVLGFLVLDAVVVMRARIPVGTVD
ncbi:hypothetical protein QDR37_14175 [Amnibacterium sp. CER49]|uniref:hypothetical protein n=1 Tax=Amnibacterium sp. CER49 TaxID=3039161 RepID=UPI00244C16BC|nr:hypothetical protein [Amnibacterium sp. CER49]MDH2445097.1 hypothetical protein [Amnibacterium sp. CER49]